MLALLSPAKSLDYESPLPDYVQHIPDYLKHPVFSTQSAQLIECARNMSVADIAALMEISPKLAEQNAERFQNWQPNYPENNIRAAILAFNGDVYEGLCAQTLNQNTAAWAQNHILILSGLYGILRPFDALQPYRLEMGLPFKNPRGDNLYQWWGTQITDYLNQCIGDNQAIVNLASQEYFKAVQPKKLKVPVIECVFQDYKNGAFKIISFYAKRARGLMARFMAEHKIKNPQDLRAFDVENYRFAADASTENKLIFRRKID